MGRGSWHGCGRRAFAGLKKGGGRWSKGPARAAVERGEPVQLQQVVRQRDQRPFAPRFVQATQTQRAEAAVFELAVDGLDDRFAPSVQRVADSVLSFARIASFIALAVDFPSSGGSFSPCGVRAGAMYTSTLRAEARRTLASEE